MTRSAVFLTNELPAPNAAGHLVYNYQILRLLERLGFTVHIVLMAPRLPHAATRLPLYARSTRTRGRWLLKVAGYCVVASPITLLKAIARDASRILPKRAVALIRASVPTLSSGRRAILGAFPSARGRDFASDAIAQLDPAVVFADTIFCASALLKNPCSRIIVLAHDVFYMRCASLEQVGFKVSPHIDKSMETRILSRADAVVACQDEDRVILERMLPSTRVVTLDHPVQRMKADAATRVPRRCIFVGSNSSPNLDGLQWLLVEIWPLVVRELPDAELHVYGAVCDVVSRTGANVVLHGLTADLTPAYLASSAGVAPLRAGSGLKIKLVEYLAHGLPAVVTTAGARGFDLGPGSPFVLADEPTEYATALRRVLTDAALRAELSENAYRYAERFSEANALRALEAVLTPSA